MLDTEIVEGAEHLESTRNIYTELEMLLAACLMTEIFEGDNTEELIQRIFGHILMQVENPRIHESSFILGQVMYLRINFLKLALTRCSTYIPKWIASKKISMKPNIH